MGRRAGGCGGAFLALALAVLAAPAAWADDPDLLSVGAGAYNALRESREAELRLEYLFSYRFLYIVRPMAGMFATNERSFYGYGGICLDLEVGQHFVIMPEAASGFWSRGNGKDLGGPVEFKTGGEVAYRFDNFSRLGLLFDHTSNAGIYNRNPGVESALVVFSIPIGGPRP
ncbi:MAG TPA: acyloxyacyl hydrolase [Stellaceae bacterium]|nr:acyloxyacyl hydrolase [Stellaceae bacterium]